MSDINVGGVLSNPSLFTVLDVRTSVEFGAFHISGSLHIPLDDLMSRYVELDKSQRFVCLCRSGSRSAAAAAFLEGKGFDARNVSGGIIAWCRKEFEKGLITKEELDERLVKINSFE